jgi:AcrR family transcriptional regulator
MSTMSTPHETTIAKPRWERRKEARPAELVSAALELFVEKGYAGTRLDDVAARAGVSKGTLYLYFENKEELFKAVVRENIVARISQSADEVLHFEGSSAELVRRLMATWWDEYGSSTAGGIGKLMMAESGNFPEIARFFLDEVIEPWHRILAAVIKRGTERGEFRIVEPDMFARVVTGPLVMLSLWKHSFGACSQQPLDANEYLAMHLDIVLSSLRPA